MKSQTLLPALLGSGLLAFGSSAFAQSTLPSSMWNTRPAANSANGTTGNAGAAASATTQGTGLPAPGTAAKNRPASTVDTLVFDPAHFTLKTLTIDGKEIRYRAYEGIVYVADPVDAKYQCLNLFVPAEYFEGGSVAGYTAETAPIFLPNTVGGYMPGLPGSPALGRGQGPGMPPPGMPQGFAGGPPPDMPAGGPPPGDIPGAAGNASGAAAQKPNAMALALAHGYVVASPGARGRTLKDATGVFTGKAPACIVDLKAAVRYLRHNAKRIPGNMERIISNGTSAGGALSALLGATGNVADYEPYLDDLGAAKERDDLFASSCYCPITNLDHADAAYEWLFAGVNNFKGRGGSAEMSPAQIALSAKLKPLFTPYLNGLKLKAPDGSLLSLDEQGAGSFADYVKSFLAASAQGALAKGEDLSKLNWLTVKEGKVTDIDLARYAVFATRMKATPAFDDVKLSTGENNLFGTAKLDNLHFTDFSTDNSPDHQRADEAIVRLLNPMSYIGAKTATTAHYWRIRHGSIDRDTSLAIPTILATRLQNTGAQVDFALVWGKGHAGDYDLDDLFAWIDQISRASAK